MPTHERLEITFRVQLDAKSCLNRSFERSAPARVPDETAFGSHVEAVGRASTGARPGHVHEPAEGGGPDVVALHPHHDFVAGHSKPSGEPFGLASRGACHPA